jgi:chlorophyllide a reductase subunit Y
MCPAFGSLRVGLRMRRTATVLSGSACCVYGLTFTSHFYGAKRTVGYVPFNSETLVTGKLFEDIREAVFKLGAKPERLRHHGHHQSLRADGLRRAAASCCRRRSTVCASSASTCRASACRPMPKRRTCSPAAMLNYARKEAEQGPVAGAAWRPQSTANRRSRSIGEMFPVDPIGDRRGCWPRWASPPDRWCRRANGASLYAALDCAVVAAMHPFYTAIRSASSKPPAGRSSAPPRSGVDGTAAWLSMPSAPPAVSPPRVSIRRSSASCRPLRLRWRRTRSRRA